MLMVKTALKSLVVWGLFTLLLLLLSLLPLFPAIGAPDTDKQPRFVSLTLCSDRLLFALADKSQIAAMSPYSRDSQMMLTQVNQDIPVVKAELSHLLPYADTTILLNESFYPRLVQRLREMGFRVIGINDNPQTVTELFALLRQLGTLTKHPEKAEALIQQLQKQTRLLKQQQSHHSNQPEQALSTLAITENGLANEQLPQFRVLFDLLHLTPTKAILTRGGTLSPEAVLRANPSVLLTFSYSDDYSDSGQLLHHPLLKSLMQSREVLHTAVKYTYCFDHGVWQGAVQLQAQRQSHAQ